MIFLIENKVDMSVEGKVQRDMIAEMIWRRIDAVYDSCRIEELTAIGEKYGSDHVYLYSYPIGDIPFVNEWLRIFHGIKNQNPIEVPEYLRTDEFLKRDYTIVTGDGLPRSGSYFLKDVTQLKKFTYTGEVEHAYDSRVANDIDREHLFLVSSVQDIISEYRVYVIDGKIENITNYNGDCTVFPDMKLINKAISLITYNEKLLRSYTIDVMVTDKGTSIVEIHNFISVGLYSTMWSHRLLDAYTHAREYLIHDNSIRMAVGKYN